MSLRIRCRNYGRGCCWEGELSYIGVSKSPVHVRFVTIFKVRSKQTVLFNMIFPFRVIKYNIDLFSLTVKKHLQPCGWKVSKCLNVGCEQHLLRKHIDEHSQYKCAIRTMKCEHCKASVAYCNLKVRNC